MTKPLQPTHSVLDQIASSVQKRLESRKKRVDEQELLRRVSQVQKPQDFLTALSGPGPHVIAEIKFKSPSQGQISSQSASNLDRALQFAEDYLANGASAISVLTEEDYFEGNPLYLSAIRQQFPKSFLLMKDFILEPYQVYEALIRGANCVLLIVALLGEERTRQLHSLANDLGLRALVEVHDEEEMAIAVRLGAPLIGINNRNLKTLKISLETSKRLVSLAPPQSILVCESGIESSEQIREMMKLGLTRFLIGTSFMKTGSPGAALSQLLREFQ
jgi:indole-3-glycerol phosphate synthase